MNRYPEPTVGAIIFNPEDRILLCRSKKWGDKYVFPGGHVEWGEKLEDALLREVKEETGLDVYDLKLVSLQESIFSDTFCDRRHFIFIDFLCRTDSSKVTLSDEAEEYVWVKEDEILEYDLGGFVREFFIELKNPNSQYLTSIFYNYIHR